jgi:hypothetical protein
MMIFFLFLLSLSYFGQPWTNSFENDIYNCLTIFETFVCKLINSQ